MLRLPDGRDGRAAAVPQSRQEEPVEAVQERPTGTRRGSANPVKGNRGPTGVKTTIP